MTPLLWPETLVVPVQNGVTASAEVGAIVGEEHVVGGQRRGEVQTFIFGEADGAISERVRALGGLCSVEGIEARVSGRIRAEQWRKFVPVAALSAMSCLAREPIGPILADPQLRAFYRQAMEEVTRLAAAEGVALEPDVVDQLLALQPASSRSREAAQAEGAPAGLAPSRLYLPGPITAKQNSPPMMARFFSM